MKYEPNRCSLCRNKYTKIVETYLGHPICSRCSSKYPNLPKIFIEDLRVKGFSLDKITDMIEDYDKSSKEAILIDEIERPWLRNHRERISQIDKITGKRFKVKDKQKGYTEEIDIE